MLELAQRLTKELFSKFDELDKERKLKYYNTSARMELIILAIDRLKEELRTYDFKDDEEEIWFFKSVMPPFLSLYIHEEEKICLDQVLLMGSPIMQFEYVKMIVTRMNDFVHRNKDFIEYYNEGKSDLDQAYFLCSEKFKKQTSDLVSKTMDFSIDMIYSVNVAMLLAYSELKAYVRELSKDLNTDGMLDSAFSMSGVEPLVWTDSKTDLTEIIYCFKEAGSFNNGQADVKQITRYFEYVFSVDLGNTSSTFQKIMSRKKGQTTYIDRLRDHINRRIDDIDENHIR